MKNDLIINEVSQEIIEYSDPCEILLISHKTNTAKELTAFKLCVIIADTDENVSELEQKYYAEVDSEIPFDLVIYKKSEWENLIAEKGTFAHKIYEDGLVIYQKCGGCLS